MTSGAVEPSVKSSYFLISIKMISAGAPITLDNPERNVTTAYFAPFDYFDIMSVSARLTNFDYSFYDFADMREPGYEYTDQDNYNIKSGQMILLAKPMLEDEYATRENIERIKDCFFYAPGLTKMSDKPFLGLITVTIIPDFYEIAAQPASIDDFILEQLICLEAIVAPFKASDDIKHDIYLTMTTGNFCVAVRAASPEIIYKIAGNIRNFKPSNYEALKNLPIYQTPGDCLIYDTFTSISMECRQTELYESSVADMCKKFAKLNEKDIQDKFKKKTVLLSFAATQEFINELVEKCNVLPEVIREQGYYRPNFLVGEYDITMRIRFEDYNKFFPVLCCRKFIELEKTHNPCSSQFFCGIKSTDREKIICHICRGIHNGSISVINERYLYDYEHSVEQNSSEKRKSMEGFTANLDRTKKVRQANNSIYERLVKSCMRENELVYGYKHFRFYMRSLHNLFKVYANLGYQNDSYINWLLFREQMLNLLNGINLRVDNIRQASNNEEKLVINKALYNDVRIAMDSIHSFQNCIQSINKLSMQSPSYNLQNNVDMEKFAVAYFQCLKEYTDAFFDDGALSNQQDKQFLLPLFSINIAEKEIFVDKLFQEMYRPFSAATDEVFNRVLVSISLPAMENFTKLYFTLPALTHEMGHHFYTARSQKYNETLAFFALLNVAKSIISQWLKGDFSKYIETHVDKELAIILAKHLYSSFVNSPLKQTLVELHQEDFQKYFKSYLINSMVESEETLSVAGEGGLLTGKAARGFLANILAFWDIERPALSDKDRSLLTEAQEILRTKTGPIKNYKKDLENYSKAQKNLAEKILGSAKRVALRVLEQKYKNLANAAKNTADQEALANLKELGLAAASLVCDFPLRKYMLIAKRWCKRIEGLVQNNILLENFKAFMSVVSSLNYYINALKDLDRITNEPCFFPIDWQHLQKDFAGLLHVYQQPPNGQLYPTLVTSEAYYPHIKQIMTTPEYVEDFKNSLTGTIVNLGGKTIEAIINEKYSLFSEIRADFAMCASMGFKSFGYLKYLSDGNFNFRAYGCEYNNSNIQRFANVLAVLVAAENPGCVIEDDEEYFYQVLYANKEYNNFMETTINAETLYNNVKQYIKTLLNATRKELEDKLMQYTTQDDEAKRLAKSKINAYFELMQNAFSKELDSVTLTENESNAIKADPYSKLLEAAKYLLIYGIFEGEKNRIHSIIYHRAVVIVKITELVELIKMVCPNQKIYLNSRLFKDLREFYCDIKAPAPQNSGAKWERLSESQLNIRDALSRYYNDYNIPLEQEKRQKDYALFCTNISFVLEYYYKNRFAYAQDNTLNPVKQIPLQGGDADGKPQTAAKVYRRFDRPANRLHRPDF